MDKIRIALIGIGGFGNQYVRTVLDDPRKELITVVGACDPRPEGCARLDELKKSGVLVWPTPEDMFKHVTADIAVISTPIFLHREHARLAFQSGCDVLLEKPISSTVEEATAIIADAKQENKHLAIGFQWCYDSAMQAFKRDIVSGRFGALLSMKAMVLWPRDLAYYARGGGWAGNRYNKQGLPVFDSVASNATAHYIMNMLYLAGKKQNLAAVPDDLQVITGRANDIDMFDTIAFTGHIGNTRLFYAASHAIEPVYTVNPVFTYIFEKGSAIFSEDDGGILSVNMANGSTVSYGRSVPNGANTEKLWCVVNAYKNNTWDSVECPGETALCHTEAMKLINACSIQDMRDRRIKDEERNAWYVPGLAQTLKDSYASETLPAVL